MIKMKPDYISDVHVVFKTHLDLGFTAHARDVQHSYFNQYIPHALQVALELRQMDQELRFVWTTGSWLIYEYLEWASPRRRIAMEKAIAQGDIAWHGLPFTTHSELMDTSLFRFGLSLSQKLDKRFGKKTIAAKMTDVPGHTRSIVPLLADAGIRFLHIGINPASTPPDVPDIFRWRQGKSEVLVAYDKTGYGHIQKVPHIKSALAFAHTGDNCGPQSVDAIIQAFSQVKRLFPRAHVNGSSLDEFAAKLLKKRHLFPAVINEIGDTWIHGAGTDPVKTANYRALCRLRSAWITNKLVDINDPWFVRFSMHLLCIPEHTWGMDEKTFLDDYRCYDHAGLRKLRRTEKCRLFESSWQEQRQYIDLAIREIVPAVLKTEARSCVKKCAAKYPDMNGFTPITDPEKAFELEHFRIAFDPAKGTINHLFSKAKNRLWFSKRDHLGSVRYALFNHANYQKFGKQYLRNWPNAYDWAIKDFTKPGIDKINYAPGIWGSDACGFFQKDNEQGAAILIIMKMPAAIARQFGCPEIFSCEYHFLRSRPAIAITLQWFRKQACRLPEAIWFSINPIIDKNGSCGLRKLGTLISPDEVIRNGNRHLHAVDDGITCADRKGQLMVRTLDAPLVAPGVPSLLDFNNKRPAVSHGFHFNLYNNVWGTNFPMWFEDDASFRFEIDFS